MRLVILLSFIFFLFGNLADINAQEDAVMSQNLAAGMAELRQDIFKRKQVYTKKLQEIVARLDSSSINEALKKEIHEFIRRDIEAGALSNSLENYDLIPKTSPFKNIYIEQYIANNQDYQIDRDLITDLTEDKVLTENGKINGARMGSLKNDFEFLGIAKNDRILLYKTQKALYPILLGYAFEGIDLLLHNYNLFDHYGALDRIDRYPNINNGNSIEFLHNGNDPRLIIKGEQWNKIVIKDPTFFEQSPGYILKSFHDNLTKDGYLYVHLNVQSDKAECKAGLPIDKIIKVAQRAGFKLIDQLDLGCQTYFKFQSIKE